MTMKKYIQYTAIVLPLLASSSCSDFLDKEPLDQRIDTNFYKTESDAMEALVAVYDVLQWNTVQGYHPTDMLADIASDDAYAGGASRTDAPNIVEVDQHNIRTANSEMYGLYRKAYIGIGRSNVLLEKIGGVSASDSFKSRVAAEAKFLRAYFYFDLVRFFENVPLILKTLSPAEAVQPQVAPAEVYNQIAKDLWEAKDALPAERLKDGRVSKWAAEALLARVYLFYNGVYKQNLNTGAETIDRTQALNLLKDIINNSGHQLLDNYADNFKRANEFSDESVFEIAYSDLRTWGDWGFIQGGEGNIGVQMRGPRVDEPGKEQFERGWSFSTATQSLVNAFEANDPRKEATLLADTEFASTISKGFQHTGYFNEKYTTAKEYKPSGGTPELNWGNNYRAIRYADVLLMAAELEAVGGNITAAQPYLNEVRDRVGLSEKTATLENIYAERRVELALEGIRYFDLLRRGVDVASAAITTTLRGPNYEGDQVDFNITFNTARKGFFPIPQAEIDVLNGQLDQNDGY